jgi:putative lipoprotein
MGPRNDSWTGDDKIQHFWISSVISGTTTAIAKSRESDDSSQFPIAMGVTLFFGVAKESYDLKTKGHWGWKDIAWDVAGALTGYMAVEALD